jgi:hypothetical protein
MVGYVRATSVIPVCYVLRFKPRSILRHPDSSLFATVVLDEPIPPRLLRSGVGACSPRVVVCPIVHRKPPVIYFKESHIDKRLREQTFSARPIDAKFNVLGRQRGKIAIGPVGRNPREQTD